MAYLDPNSNCSVFPNENCWQWFNAENVHEPPNDPKQNPNSGCIADEYNNVTAIGRLIDPASNESTAYLPASPVNFLGFPCYTHATMANLLDGASPTPIAWKYYARSPGQLWTAPTAFKDLCQPSGHKALARVRNGLTTWDRFCRTAQTIPTTTPPF